VHSYRGMPRRKSIDGGPGPSEEGKREKGAKTTSSTKERERGEDNREHNHSGHPNGFKRLCKKPVFDGWEVSPVAGMIYARELMEGNYTIISRREKFRHVSESYPSIDRSTQGWVELFY